jgi:hypothetical protein
MTYWRRRIFSRNRFKVRFATSLFYGISPDLADFAYLAVGSMDARPDRAGWPNGPRFTRWAEREAERSAKDQSRATAG